MTTRIKLRRDTAANWASANPVLALGEPGYDTTNNELRVGDGVTAWAGLESISGSGSSDVASDWTDGINDNVWRIATVSGSKQFDFETEGYKLFEYTYTSSQTGVTSLALDVADYPEVADMWWNSDSEGNGYTIYKGSATYGNEIAAGYNTYADGILTIGIDGYDFNNGEKLTVKYWSEGTRTVDMYTNTYGWLIPDQSETGTVNTVTIDAAEHGVSSDLANLTTNTSRHAITFKNYSRTFSRNITAVAVEGDLYTITFDGTPLEIKTLYLETVTTKAQNGGENSTGSLEIPYSAIPDWGLYAKFGWESTSTNKYTGDTNRSGYLTINGSEPVDFTFWNAKNSDNKNWQIELASTQTWNTGDTIEVHWYRWDSRIELDIYQPTTVNSNWNNGYRWFDYKTDMPEYNAIRSNGITGGKGTVMCKTYTEEKDYSEYTQWNFAWAGNDNDNSYDPYDTYKNNTIWNGDSTNNPFYYFSDDDGMIYRSDWQMNGQWSRKLKVRIMYKFEFNITGEEDYDWWC
jgi:hypothetical protein